MAKNKSMGLVFALGAAAGYIATLFLSDSTKLKHKKVMKDKARDLERIMKDPNERQRVIDVFKEYSDESASYYRQAKENLVSGLASLKGGVTDIDKKKYQRVLDDIIEDFKQTKKIPTKQLDRLRTTLEADYVRIKEHMNQANDEEARTV